MTNAYAGDCRRATALACHYGNGNTDGMRAVLNEAIEDNRVTPLIVAVLDLAQYVFPVLLTNMGIGCVSDVVFRLTQAPSEPRPDRHRAARIIVAHASNNVDGINAVLAEAAEARAVTELITAILELFGVACSPLYTPLGLDALQQATVDLAVKEAETA